MATTVAPAPPLSHHHLHHNQSYNKHMHMMFMSIGFMEHQSSTSIRDSSITKAETTGASVAVTEEPKLIARRNSRGNSHPSPIGKDVISLCKAGRLKEALQVVDVMDQRSIPVDANVYSALLQACIDMKALAEGKEVHAHILQSGMNRNFSLRAKLVVMYAMCESLAEARLVFDKMSKRSVFLWNTMIIGYAKDGQCEETLRLYYQMQMAGVKPNNFTYSCVLKACGDLSALQQGEDVHKHMIKTGFASNVFVESALVAMYAQLGKVEAARQLFDRMFERDVACWNSMIAGYSQNGHANEALELFWQMQADGIRASPISTVSVLQACAHLGALQQGKEIHDYVIRSGFESNVFVGSALVAMYSECGSIEAARQVFDKMSQRNVVTWTAMIAGYGMNGHGVHALTVFCQMQQAGLEPNYITFIAVLSACSHAGLVSEGWQYFNSLSRDYNIIPRMEHYACMVDLLSRAGQLDEAYSFIQGMPIEPDSRVWGALLNACKIHSNIDIAENVAKHLFELEPENAGNYILLSNIYAGVGRWDDAANVRAMMKDVVLKKRLGCTWIQVKNRVHSFLVGDTSHPQSKEIYAMLESLAWRMKEAGYVPATEFVFHDVEDNEKENILCGHSEKLAIAFGLISTSPGTPIHITKNLRVCDDCHSATKFISKIVGREIIARDANRFHHFKDGACSCGDYW